MVLQSTLCDCFFLRVKKYYPITVTFGGELVVAACLSKRPRVAWWRSSVQLDIHELIA